MSLKRNGREIFCCACGKHKPVEGAENEKGGHRKICAECVEKQNEAQPEETDD